VSVSFTNAAEEMYLLKSDFKDLIGYSHAAYEICNAFERAGIDVSIANPNAKIGISMGYPTDYSFYPDQYKIGYTAWESTKLKAGWKEKMQSCDEIWATSSWTARVFKKQLGRDVHVYPHGINHDWSIHDREVVDTFRFLHVGEPQIRKGGQLVVDAFTEQFGKDPKYQLILKTSGFNTTRIYGPDGAILGSPDSKYPNILLINDKLTHEKMIGLYHLCNAMVYPTAGEGFGFIPLQALATGMPTISTWQWAEYKEFITIKLKSNLDESIHNELHPGLTYRVDKEELKKSMVDMVENYNVHKQNALKASPQIHKKYDWDVVSKDTIKRIKNIF
jgi:glycosyltransferase involved in cell wall biosynthesis